MAIYIRYKIHRNQSVAFLNTDSNLIKEKSEKIINSEQF